MINLAVIGLGLRGIDNIGTLSCIDDVDVVSVCDLLEDRVEEGAKKVEEVFGHRPKTFTDYKEALKLENISAVMVFTGWQDHSDIAIYSMKKGIPVACEVGAEYSLDRCHELVHTYEETKTPYMLLENCCFGEEELLVTSMVRKGLLGEISFCAGAYTHDLREAISYGLKKRRYYRFENYHRRNCDNYPTHDLGPISKLLNINRGNRIVSVTAMASKSKGLKEYISTRDDLGEIEKNTEFMQADIVETLIKCSNGELIRLHLDTTLPTFYNRDFTVCGTKGRYNQIINSFYFDGEKEDFNTWKYVKDNINNAEKYNEYMPDIWKKVTDEEREKGHGGMDYFCFKTFIENLKAGKPMPIDVYDAACWMAISVLTEQSVLQGGTTQMMPDFTHGRWINREPSDVVEL